MSQVPVFQVRLEEQPEEDVVIEHEVFSDCAAFWLRDKPKDIVTLLVFTKGGKPVARLKYAEDNYDWGQFVPLKLLYSAEK